LEYTTPTCGIPQYLADEIESIQNRCMNIQQTYYIALFTFISYITSALLIYPSKTADWQSTELVTNKFSIFAQVNITNPTSWLVKFDVLSCYIHLQVNITKPKSSKWPPSRFVEVTDKEISEIKINSVPKNTKNLCKNTKTIIRR
jgi:hypothetical protein